MLSMGDTAIPDLKADEQPEVTEIESVCFHCYKTGITRLLVVKIAFFREVIISSFSCPHCGFENRSLDPAARVQNKGQRITLSVQSQKDINRRAVRPAGSSIEIPELDASFPTSDGDISTIEGVILGIANNIEQLQTERKLKQPDLAEKLETFLKRLRGLLSLEQPFTLVLDDPSGNAFIENYLAPDADPQLKFEFYQRTPEQDAVLGIRPDADDQSPADTLQSSSATLGPPVPNDTIGKDEVLNFKVNCPNCNAQSSTRMKLVDIPHFKQVVIMATVCPECGYKDSEAKASGGVSPKGRLYRLKLTHATDLSRDLLLSETARIRIPDLDLESQGGTLGGRFTTLEGLLLAVCDQLTSTYPFVFGDSAPQDEKTGKLALFIEQLKSVASGKRLGVTFELRDPAGNSYLQNLYAPDPDPELEIVDYERTPEENDDLGLTDMKTTDYEDAAVEKSGDAV